MITVKLLPARNLTPGLWSEWNAIQECTPTLDSPYFRAEFAREIAEVRGNLEVGVLHHGQKVIGFFPFHRHANNIGRPLGEILSDFQGVVIRDNLEWNADDLVKQCGLNAWDYDHVLASQTPFQSHHRAIVDSTYIDLSQGFDSYWDERWKQEHKRFKQIKSSMRKIERELGPLRLEFGSCDNGILDTLSKWKSAQYRRSGILDLHEIDWIQQLLQRLLEVRSVGFSVVLSGLYAGDRLIAAAYMLRSRDVLHGWFMSYDRELASYAPGLVLLTEAARAAAGHGVRRFDLGKGEESYKPKLASGKLLVCEGSVDRTYLRRAVRGVVLRAASSVHSSPLRKPIADLTRPVRRYWKYVSSR